MSTAHALSATAFLRAVLLGLEERAGPAPAGDGPRPVKATLGQVADLLDERAFGLMLLLLAIPCSIPFVHVLPQIFSLPMIALAGQMAAGRESPWLPKALGERTFDVVAARTVLDRASRYIGWVEKLARPRLAVVTGRTGARATGALLVVPCASILFPMIGTNTVPSIGVALTSVGMMERDGVLVILGLLVGVGWVFFLVAMITIFGVEAVSFMKTWIAARF